MTDLKEKLIMMEDHSSLFENEIKKLPIQICPMFLRDGEIVAASFKKTDRIISTIDNEEVKKLFPKTYKESENKVMEAVKANIDVKGKRVAVLFSGGPAAGGHNVVAGLKKALGKHNTLLGVKAGPKGLLEGNLFELRDEDINNVINTGGFDLLGSDRTKIKTEEQFEQVKDTVRKFKLDAIVVIGGDDSNTNACVLAEILYDLGVQVIGVPKTIDGDLQVGDILPISFGFDTATKIYSELIGNILQDTPSSRKYWHFIKLMGRSASHVALECALQTHPALCLISEEVEEKNMSLREIISNISDVIIKRAAKGIYHGVIIVPEGLIEFIPEVKVLIKELNELLAKYEIDLKDKPSYEEKRDFIYKKLTPESVKVISSLPYDIERMLLLERDSHGNLQVSMIPTEKLLVEMVTERLHEVKKHPEEIAHLNLTLEEFNRFKNSKFQSLNHFFGYEGRCGAPTLFDAAYTFNLGLGAGSLILDGKTGYMISITNFEREPKVLALPLTGLINIERRHGKNEPVIKKGLVEINSPAFKFFAERREIWAERDHFSSPGPRQLWGPISRQLPITVALNQGYKSLDFNFGEEIKIN